MEARLANAGFLPFAMFDRFNQLLRCHPVTLNQGAALFVQMAVTGLESFSSSFL